MKKDDPGIARGRLIAVNHVHLQAAPSEAERLEWFYGQVIGLRRLGAATVESESTAEGLRFVSDRVELRIGLVEHPQVESVAFTALFEVPSLVHVAEVLAEQRYEFQWHRGLQFTDRHLSLLDPAGNRVQIRRQWPAGLFPPAGD